MAQSSKFARFSVATTNQQWLMKALPAAMRQERAHLWVTRLWQNNDLCKFVQGNLLPLLHACKCLILISPSTCHPLSGPL